jgi:hypothetical protein
MKSKTSLISQLLVATVLLSKTLWITRQWWVNFDVVEKTNIPPVRNNPVTLFVKIIYSCGLSAKNTLRGVKQTWNKSSNRQCSSCAVPPVGSNMKTLTAFYVDAAIWRLHFVSPIHNSWNSSVWRERCQVCVAQHCHELRIRKDWIVSYVHRKKRKSTESNALLKTI